MTHLALATYHKLPTLYPDEAPLVAELQRRGFVVSMPVWDDSSVDWSVFDLVLLRNVWDYHHKPQQFEAWLAHLEAQAIPVYNLPQLVRWNINKRYLLDLQAAGIRTIPTLIVDAQNLTDLQAIMQEKNWQEVIVKPVISASGEDTFRITQDAAAAHQAVLEAIARRDGAIVQPFLPQISAGEWSLVFFNGNYSHAVLKTPRTGEYLVHEERGGTNQIVTPERLTIEQAQRALHYVHARHRLIPLYARVDGLLVDGDFVLMELECVEPELYFSYADFVAPRFVDALLSVI